jgi:Thoeris protein ThsB, TIR-like domain
MAYRNKTYVAFDADSDIRYYRLMTAWKQNDNTNFDFYNAHDLNNIWYQSNEETIKRRLRERLNNTRVFVLLVGEKTKFLYKFVRWEIEQALSMDLPIIAVNLNGKRAMDDVNCPSILKSELALHVSFNSKIIQLALENWENYHKKMRGEGKSGPFYYSYDNYNSLGL